MTAKIPSNPVPVILDNQDNGLWALQAGELIRLKEGTLPGCKISQQAVGGSEEAGEVVRREFREEENRKHVHLPPLFPFGGD